MWRDGSTEVPARENELLRARGWSNNADAGVAMWPCDTTCADGCGRTMNGLFDLHLLCITLRERRARSRYGHRASILREAVWLHEPFLRKGTPHWLCITICVTVNYWHRGRPRYAGQQERLEINNVVPKERRERPANADYYRQYKGNTMHYVTRLINVKERTEIMLKDGCWVFNDNIKIRYKVFLFL